MNSLAPRAVQELRDSASSIQHFANHFLGITLRPYQVEAAEAIIESAFKRDGESFVVIFSRQSGKDEVIAAITLFLLFRTQEIGSDMVCAQPTFKPQTINAMERIKKRGLNFGKRLTRTAGYIMRMGAARISYFSAEESANQVGATADRLLIMNEAQDIKPSLYDKRFAPMAASGNATRVFSGTAWTSRTLLSREMNAALMREKQDGKKRVFIANADKVAESNIWYGEYVRAEVLKLGRNHPMIKTQYYCEEIDAEAGMFNSARMALMKGDQPAHSDPIPGTVYIFCIDVGGVDEATNADPEAQFLNNPGRDSTSLTIYSVDLSEFEIRQAPIFRIVYREQWQGQNHVIMWSKLKAYNDIWQPQTLIMDATGVGEGLYSMFSRCCGHKTIPIKFSAQKKSEIGYRYLGMIETGRIRDCAPSKQAEIQYISCQSEVLTTPQKTMRWGVKNLAAIILVGAAAACAPAPVKVVPVPIPLPPPPAAPAMPLPGARQNWPRHRRIPRCRR